MHPYLIAPPRLSHMGTQPKSVAERFWGKVDKSGECWIWTAGKAGDGCGTMAVGSLVDGSMHMERASRVSWRIHFGDFPEELLVCHKCDNPTCVRPDHLFLGTHLDNMRDCAAKGRVARGERLKQTKLNEEQVREIRRLYVRRKYGCPRIARQFGVTEATIRRVVRRECWAHVPPDGC